MTGETDQITAARIQARLDALGISARAASLEAGMAADGIRNILRGKSRSPRVESLQRLAKALRCSVPYLLGEEDQPGGPPLPPAGVQDDQIMRDQAARLRRLRERFGLIPAAAAAARVSEDEWERMETGEARIDPVALWRFCNYHEISGGYVITGSLAGLPDDVVRELVRRELAEAVAAARREQAQGTSHSGTSGQTRTDGTARQAGPAD